MTDPLGRLMRAFHLASCIPLVGLAVVTAGDVIARYALATSVPDAIEISGLLLGLVISLALAPVTFAERQVRIEGVPALMGGRPRQVADAVIRLIATAIFALMGWQAIERSAYSYRIGEYAGLLETPIWPVKAVFAAGVCLTALSLLVRLYQGLSGQDRRDHQT